MTNIPIVNESDKIIKYKQRGTLDQSDIYRCSALWLTNSNGEILLAQRKFTKKNDPGKWGPAVAGTNEEGETYESNMIKEAEEELGLKGCTLEKSDIKTRRSGKHNYFAQWFTLIIDRKIEDFTIQEDEVEKIKWFSKDGLLKELEDNPDKFLKSIKEHVKTFSK